MSTQNTEVEERPLVDMPSPTKEEMADPAFIEIFNAIKNWDVNVPQCYNGYCAPNGSHVVMILRALRGVPAIATEP